VVQAFQCRPLVSLDGENDQDVREDHQERPLQRSRPAGPDQHRPAHEKKVFNDLPEATRAYERAADKYADRFEGTDALYRVGESYNKQAKKAEYDQSLAGQAIATYTDFITLHPEDKRASQAQKKIEALKLEQARGAFEIARYYERKKKWKAAKIYYGDVNDVLRETPDAKLAAEARSRLDDLAKRHPEASL